MEIKSIKVKPDPPKKWQKVTMILRLIEVRIHRDVMSHGFITFSAEEEVTSEVALKLNYGLIPIGHESLDLKIIK